MKIPFYIKYLFLFLLLQQCFYLPAQELQFIDSIRNLIKSSPDDKIKISALISISNLYQDKNSDIAFEFGLQALAFSTRLNYRKGVAESHNNLGDLYWYKADYLSSSDHYFKALKIYQDLKDSAAIADCYRNIGWIYDYKKNYNDALYYYSKAFTFNQTLKRNREIGKNYNDIGIINQKLGKYNEAILSFQNSLKIQKEIINNPYLAVIYTNMAETYNKMGKFNLAIENIEKSIQIDKKSRDNRYLSESYISLAEIYIKINRYSEAIISLRNAINFAKKINDKTLLKKSYDNLLSIYAKQNNFLKALQYLNLSAAIKDSIYNENNNKQVREMTSFYESEKKELMIKNLEKEKALSDGKLRREKNFRISLIIFCSMIAVFVFVLFRGIVQKRKANTALSFAYEEIEEKNKDITDSINYSKRIQDASLSPIELKNKIFPDAFVLFKPKDIVSGDFYWFTEKNGKKLIATCDCTGHGVPGALMSMIGNNILNQIVNEKEITAPDEILNLLHKEIRKALKQEEHGGTKDGMDIALVTFLSETEIEYAGAHRPLWIVAPPGLPPAGGVENQRTSPIGDTVGSSSSSLSIDGLGAASSLIEIKADKFPIGGLQSEAERKFTKHKISVSKGDCIYIFSDGFVDQFGGAEGKKFMSKKFKELLLANCSLPMTGQEKIISKTLENWRGITEQIDDILVIGIKI